MQSAYHEDKKNVVQSLHLQEPYHTEPQRYSVALMHLRGNRGLVLPLESPHLSFIPVATGRTVSELTGLFTSGLSHSDHPLGTPQATRGKGGSITPSYCHSVISRSYASMGCFSVSSVIIITDQMSNVKRKKTLWKGN